MKTVATSLRGSYVPKFCQTKLHMLLFQLKLLPVIIISVSVGLPQTQYAFQLLAYSNMMSESW